MQVYVHTYASTDQQPDEEHIARVEGHGSVTDAWVRERLGPTARFTIRSVCDLAGQAPVDSWEIPDRHRTAVHLMTPADAFPFASCTSRDMQTDHTIPFHQRGPSGIYLWQDPHGQTYLVDHTGTRRLSDAPTPRVRTWTTEIDIVYAPAA